MKKEVLLSVIIISYNQGKYIGEAIESVLNQKVDFEYELLLADDCSPDNTAEIIQEYSKKNKNIKVLKRSHNLGGTANLLDAVSKGKGKYITLLEGDDYWIDENKLQTQVSFLEKHSDFVGVTHLQEGRNDEGKVLGIFPYKYRNDFVINGVDELLKGKIFSSTSTLYRNIYKETKHLENLKYLFSLDKIVGDLQLCNYLSSIGKIKVLNKPMMVYRMRSNDGASNYNSTHSINDIAFTYFMLYKNLNDFFEYKYNYYGKIKEYFTLGVAYDICKFKYKDIKRFMKELPKQYKFRTILSFPITCIKILYNRFNRKK